MRLLGELAEMLVQLILAMAGMAVGAFSLFGGYGLADSLGAPFWLSALCALAALGFASYFFAVVVRRYLPERFTKG